MQSIPVFVCLVAFVNLVDITIYSNLLLVGAKFFFIIFTLDFFFHVLVCGFRLCVRWRSYGFCLQTFLYIVNTGVCHLPLRILYKIDLKYEFLTRITKKNVYIVKKPRLMCIHIPVRGEYKGLTVAIESIIQNRF